DKLSHMINQLLVLASAEAGEIQWTNQSVDLSSLAVSLAEQLEPVAIANKVRLEAKTEPGLNVLGDSSWLERIIINLLDNAIKFTPENGQVVVTTAVENGQAVLRVTDSGIGIEPAALPHIFERFNRAEPSRSKQIDGVGLGLTLVKWIVDQHHGRIEVDSAP